ncbi:hypothetical protein L9G16_13570 [Shewanella sp. A25]|nr:hypothetical protein [Shewanella shenzhenensis]
MALSAGIGVVSSSVGAPSPAHGADKTAAQNKPFLSHPSNRAPNLVNTVSSSSNVSHLSGNAIASLQIDATATTQSNVIPSTVFSSVLDVASTEIPSAARATLHTEFSGFNLLTGASTIGNMRAGQIVTTPAVTSVTTTPISSIDSLTTGGITTVGNSTITPVIPFNTASPSQIFAASTGVSRVPSKITPLADIFTGEVPANSVASQAPFTPFDNSVSKAASEETIRGASTTQTESIADDIQAVADKRQQRQQALAAIFNKEQHQARNQEEQESTEAQQKAAQDQQKDQINKAKEQAAAQQQAQLNALKSRDAEVKAHEQAHATVGGQYAQSPSFKYENGSDGQRYATDGEVQIDVSAVAGDPLATITKMKQVYAAAMAPVDPSSADLRVAAEALSKINDAKAKLAEERQSQVIEPETAQTLIGAQAEIDQLPSIEPRKIAVSGEVDANGNIVPAPESPTLVSETVNRLKQTIAKPVANAFNANAVEGENRVDAESIELPTATLAVKQDTLDVSEEKSEVELPFHAADREAQQNASVRFYRNVYDNETWASGKGSTLEAAETTRPSVLASNTGSQQEHRGLFNASTIGIHSAQLLDISA